MKQLRVVPLELKRANELVLSWHRHHKPVVGHRFSIGAINEQGELVGAAIVGRPVARLIDQSKVLEITRLVTNGCPNACSFLYGACARVGRELGYEKIQTYILNSEDGASVKAAGFVNEGEAGGGTWVRDGRTRRTDQPIVPKQRYVKWLR